MINQIKVHRPLYQGVIYCLEKIFVDGYYADKVIERVFKENPKWGSRDRAFIAETVYDIVRYWRLYHYLIELDIITPNKVNFDSIIQVHFLVQKKQIPQFDWQHKLEQDKIINVFNKLKQIEIIESFPDWLHNYGMSQLGEQWIKEMHALNEAAPLVLRVNTLRAKFNDVYKIIVNDKRSVKQSDLSKNAVIIQERYNIFTTDLFKNGLVEVQDEGSQVIGEFCGVKEGMRVIDACAGAGGKSLQLAALMNNKGKIIAMDIEARKLEELKKRSRRASAFNIETRLIENSKAIKKLENSADVLLLDVPCSGSGVIRRNPDAKWKLQQTFIDKIIGVQQKILNEYSIMVKKGGVMIYSTCSLFPSENQNQIDLFVKNNSEFELLITKTLTPAKNNTDGFFMAKLVRKI